MCLTVTGCIIENILILGIAIFMESYMDHTVVPFHDVSLCMLLAFHGKFLLVFLRAFINFQKYCCVKFESFIDVVFLHNLVC